MIDLFSLGRVTIDLFSQDVGAPFEEISGYNAYAGGTPLNIAVGVQRLGLQTAMLTGTSGDGVGRFVRNFLSQEGVITDYMFHKEGTITNAFLLSIQPPDTFEPTVYQANCADLLLDVADVRRTPVQQARAVLFTGIGLISHSSMSASLLAAELCAASGGKVFVDIDYKTAHWLNADEFGAMMRAALCVTDVVMGTEGEVCAAGGSDDPETAAKRLLSLVREAVILKRGAHGATLFTKDGTRTEAPVFPVEVLNVFGAGDAFAAGVIYGRLQGMGWPQTMRLASACGAYIVTQHGCANDMPTLEQVRSFTANQ